MIKCAVKGNSFGRCDVKLVSGFDKEIKLRI